jgi:hypothetical protein
MTRRLTEDEKLLLERLLRERRPIHQICGVLRARGIAVYTLRDLESLAEREFRSVLRRMRSPV